MKYLSMLLLVTLAGCSSNPPSPPPETLFSDPPHLWSGQKNIDQSPEVKQVERLRNEIVWRL